MRINYYVYFSPQLIANIFLAITERLPVIINGFRSIEITELYNSEVYVL